MGIDLLIGMRHDWHEPGGRDGQIGNQKQGASAGVVRNRRAGKRNGPQGHDSTADRPQGDQSGRSRRNRRGGFSRRLNRALSSTPWFPPTLPRVAPLFGLGSARSPGLTWWAALWPLPLVGRSEEP